MRRKAERLCIYLVGLFSAVDPAQDRMKGVSLPPCPSQAPQLLHKLHSEGASPTFDFVAPIPVFWGY